MTASEKILIAARKLIEKPENWTQHRFARDQYNKTTDPFSDNAVCFCSVGAMALASYGHALEHVSYAKSALANVVKDYYAANSVIEFNDHASHAHVLDAFDRAIQIAQ